jgi:hypothetical protein
MEKEVVLKYTRNNRSLYKSIDAYVEVKEPHLWMDCPTCGLKPIVWEFNNGSSTACGCGESIYNHFSIHAESVMSYINRNGGSALHYDNNELLKNWNHYCLTGEILFEHAGKRSDGRW